MNLSLGLCLSFQLYQEMRVWKFCDGKCLVIAPIKIIVRGQVPRSSESLCERLETKLLQLLQLELNRYLHVHGHRFAMQLRGCVLPVTQRVFCGLLQERWAGNNGHAGNMSIGI